jgi:hypothetical protein
MACSSCAPEPNLDKRASFMDHGNLDFRCQSCGKAPLDAVMLQMLSILVDRGLRDEQDGLMTVGTPLVEVGYPLAYPPRLGERELVVASENVTRQAAEEILRKVPEVKGVLHKSGVPGVVDIQSSPGSWELLAGCDLRVDIVQSIFGELAIYKNQSEIHIEFPRQNSPKLDILERLYFQKKLVDVVDGLCGPGTLGLTCVLAGAKRVVLNDAWLPAVENTVMNIEANRELLGIDEICRMETARSPVGSEPVLIACASGGCEIEVYHGDLKKLFSRARPAPTCLIDHFPGANIEELKKACTACKDVVVI